jgi:hypothetical protein
MQKSTHFSQQKPRDSLSINRAHQAKDEAHSGERASAQSDAGHSLICIQFYLRDKLSVVQPAFWIFMSRAELENWLLAAHTRRQWATIKMKCSELERARAGGVAGSGRRRPECRKLGETSGVYKSGISPSVDVSGSFFLTA